MKLHYTTLARLRARDEEIKAIRAAALEDGIARFPPGPLSGTPHSVSLIPDRYHWPDPLKPTWGTQFRQLRSLW